MDQAIAGATIQVVLQALLSAPIDEIKLVVGFEKELSKLKESVLMIQDFIDDAEVKQVTIKAVKRWLEELEDVAFEADAVLGECNYQLLRQKVKKLKRPSNKVLCFLPSGSKNLFFRTKMAHKIDDVNKKLKAIQEKAEGFGLKNIVMSSDHASVGFIPTLTDSKSIEPQIVGRDNDESTLVETLLDAVEHKTVSVLPVMGMGGLGKTTLVRKVFHNVKIEAHFEKKIWVCVSTHFDATTLLKMILESLTKKNVQNILTREVVLEKVQEALASKRYLLILDDVWNENVNLWDDFMNSISSISPNKGNCILVTTRKEKVASLVGTLRTYRLQSLSEDDCWSIIRFKALLMVDDYIEFEGIGKLIAQRCGGLPLVAMVLGGLLRGKSKIEWQSLLDQKLLKFKLDGVNNNVMDILKLSYDRLPSPSIKKCFAYCSIFPQDHEIKRREVIELWMAEGFLHEGMETVGDEIFNLLLQNSLFQEEEKDRYNNITKCRMHDLVHDLACLVSGSRTFTVEKGISDGLQRPRYLVESGEESFAILKQQARFLRTIFFQEGNVYMCVEFRQLHVLKIMNWRIEELPDAIGELKQLRLLDIENTRITELPDSIGKLYNLQTIYLPLRLRSLPNTIVDLISLRHLHIDDDGNELPPWMGKLTCLQTLPYFKVGDRRGCGIGELGKLNNLKGSLKIQNLERVKDKEEAQDANLKGKENIVELVLEWNDTGEGEVNYENVLDGLQPHPSLKSLEIVWYKSSNWPSWTMNMAVQVLKLSYCPELESIIPCVIGFTSLRKLKITLCSKLKELSLNQLLTLEKLIIEDCGELESISCVEGLPSLRVLIISECPGLIELPIELLQSSSSSLRSLELLNLENVENLSISLSNMSALQDLTITNIPKLKEIRLDLSTIEELSIGDCRELKSIIIIPYARRVGDDSQHQYQREEEGEKGIILSSLQKLRINSCPGLIELPIELFQSSSSLRELELFGLENVENLSISLSNMSALQDLTIVNIPKLKEIRLDLSTIEELSIGDCRELKSIIIIPYARRVGDDSQHQHQEEEGEKGIILSSLQKLEINNCPGLIELPIELFQSSSSIRDLALYDLPNLCNLERVLIIPTSTLSNMSALQYLTIRNITKLTTFPTIQGISGLRILHIGGFSSSSISSDSFNQHLNSILQENLRSLTFLRLYGNEDWDCLPDQIQHLTSLTDLWLIDFGRIEALPEWIRNLSSLKLLSVENCKSLRHLPSKEAMLSLTKLKRLWIENCPLLAERCRDPSNNSSSAAAAATTTEASSSSEWHKIKHIKNVHILCKSVSFFCY